MKKTAEKGVHEQLVQISKRAALPTWQSWLIRIAAVLASLIVCAVIIVLFTGNDPFDIYATMFKGAVGTSRRIWSLLQGVAMLLCVSLAVTPAFKMRFWNIGAEGQVLMGGLATAACMILFGSKLPSYLLLPLVIVASIVAGAIWAVIPAVFKAIWNTNETLFTLMMNYIAIQIVSYFTYIWSVPKGSGKIGVINAATQAGWLPSIGKYSYLLKILIVCGVAGLLLVAGTDHTITRDTAGGRGFTAIMVSWLAKFNPLYMILTSLLLVFMQKGAIEISTKFGLNDSFSDIIMGIIIFFIIGSEFFINYTIRFRSRKGAQAK